MEPQQQQENRRIGIILVVLAAPIVVALYGTALVASWALVPAAWHLLVSQFTG